MYVSCHRHFFPVLHSNQRWSPPLRLQASHCSTFRIMCDVPSIAVFCSESIEWFPAIVSKFFFREYNVAANLLLLFMMLISLVSVLNLLYFYISTFRSMCAVPNMAVLCISLTPCFPGMLLTYFLNDFEIALVARIITGITFVFTLHMHCISIVRSLYFRIFSASFLITFLSPEIATSVNIHVPFSLSRIVMSGWLLVIIIIIIINSEMKHGDGHKRVTKMLPF